MPRRLEDCGDRDVRLTDLIDSSNPVQDAKVGILCMLWAIFGIMMLSAFQQIH